MMRVVKKVIADNFKLELNYNFVCLFIDLNGSCVFCVSLCRKSEFSCS